MFCVNFLPVPLPALWDSEREVYRPLGFAAECDYVTSIYCALGSALGEEVGGQPGRIG
jgi:hypothetical protein